MGISYPSTIRIVGLIINERFYPMRLQPGHPGPSSHPGTAAVDLILLIPASMVVVAEPLEAEGLSTWLDRGRRLGMSPGRSFIHGIRVKRTGGIGG
ncbi:hypothetical protein KEJ44_08760 [Candidatus Bathyarchaeota archaeon]|nr:hypothetical protein [Candidatus Bathyarchaeota archaeon]